MVMALAYAWLINPVRPTDVHPDQLRTDYREDWVRLAALSFLSDGNFARMQSRLSRIDNADATVVIKDVVEHYSRPGQHGILLRLQALAESIDLQLAALDSGVDVLAIPATSKGARLEGGSAAPAVRVVQRTFACHPRPNPRVEIVLVDAAGEGVAGARVWLVSDQGADWAVTGLTPASGSGYADFEVEEGIRYSIGVGELGPPLLTGLQIEACSDEGEDAVRSGAWRILIEQRPGAEAGSQADG
jgi:hypothetical protein